MSSLSEKISILSNPAPTVLDPEDDVNIETVAKVQKRIDNSEALFTTSELRSKAGAVLGDSDPAYFGKKVSRKSLDGIFHHDPKGYLGSDDKTDEENDDDDDEISEDSRRIEEYNRKMGELISNKEYVEEESEGSEDLEISGDISNEFSNVRVTSEREKRDAVKTQKAIWDKLCTARIKLQRLLVLVNKLPQPDVWEIYKRNGGEEMSECMSKASDSAKEVLDTCLDLQAGFRNKIENESRNYEESARMSDEEIPSDTDEEMKEECNNQKHANAIKPMKRKLKCSEYSKILTKNFESLMPYRNSVIQKWDEKTKLSTGNITQKSFSAFETSTLKQIEQIMQDENRLIKRTQLKRSLYRVIGKPDVSETKTEQKAEGNESESKQDILLKDYDEEIFDDEDFYRKLLKEIIESKTEGMDPALLKKHMEIESIRNKMKKKVDTKASKGRKIRYNVHPKLVGFMRKQKTCTISDEARANLIKNMFGRNNLSST